MRSAALPHMQELAEASGETVTLGLYDPVRQQTYVLAVVESDAPFRYVSKLHEWRDLYTGASGRAVMAFLPEEERRAIVDRTQLAPATEHTITSADELEAVLAEVRERGYALEPGGAPPRRRRHRGPDLRRRGPVARRGRPERPDAAVRPGRRAAARPARGRVRGADRRRARRRLTSHSSVSYP